ncbi:MAG: PEP-CTERM sorting domain-containing protein [Planctomycetes bacterium]|nr:PEP-CTERM sorting domain-containing protein [Planctomycetota bacterium]
MASAANATPIYDVFGPLPQATFGGTGIPNTEVAVGSQFADGSDVLITIAMSATQRYSNPALTNDGAGTYFAQTGSNDGLVGNPTIGALWNFNFYMEVEGFNGATPKLTDYQINLYYDFDPGFDTPLGSLGVIDVTAGLALLDPNATVAQGSENLLFGYLATSSPPFWTAPGGAFDPNAVGEYNFAIQVSNGGGFGIETIAMDVQVVPEPATIGLAAFGLIAMGVWRRKR